MKDWRAEGLSALLRAPSDKTLDDYMIRLDSENRPSAFLALAESIFETAPDPRFWSWLWRWWGVFDAIPHQQFCRAFKKHRSAWTPLALKPHDLEAYNSLPAKVVVYRGQGAFRPLGISWTLDRNVARDFARGHRNIPVPEPRICQATVLRRSIAGVLKDRNESEVVLFNPPTNFIAMQP